MIPNIFDFDIDNNKYFDFIDLDLILKYMNYQINSSYNWWENIVFTNEGHLIPPTKCSTLALNGAFERPFHKL